MICSMSLAGNSLIRAAAWASAWPSIPLIRSLITFSKVSLSSRSRSVIHDSVIDMILFSFAILLADFSCGLGVALVLLRKLCSGAGFLLFVIRRRVFLCRRNRLARAFALAQRRAHCCCERRLNSQWRPSL